MEKIIVQESDCCFVAVPHSCLTCSIHAKDIQTLKNVGQARLQNNPYPVLKSEVILRSLLKSVAPGLGHKSHDMHPLRKIEEMNVSLDPRNKPTAHLSYVPPCTDIYFKE